jgi:hypothetical protein
MQAHETPVGATAASASLSADVLIEIQRRTVAEHIRNEQIKDWPEVYRTFTPHAEDAYYDVALLCQIRSGGFR